MIHKDHIGEIQSLILSLPRKQESSCAFSRIPAFGGMMWKRMSEGSKEHQKSPVFFAQLGYY